MKAGLLALGLFAYATPAHAQMTWPNKGFFAVDFGVQLATHEFDTDATFSLYDENGRLQTTQEGKNSPFIEFRGGYKVWSNLLVGVGYSWATSKSDVAITASIPDPAVFDHLRTATLSAADASTSEGALDFSGTWMVPVTDKIDVAVLAGPTVFFVKKDVASSVTATEPGPVATATITEESETNVGFPFRCRPALRDQHAVRGRRSGSLQLRQGRHEHRPGQGWRVPARRRRSLSLLAIAAAQN